MGNQNQVGSCCHYRFCCLQNLHFDFSGNVSKVLLAPGLAVVWTTADCEGLFLPNSHSSINIDFGGNCAKLPL